MATITLQGNQIDTIGELPEIGSKAPNFSLVMGDLSEITLASYIGKKVILNIFPSLDTPVCAVSVRRFNAEVSKQDNTVVLCISGDLPFAHSRFCSTEGLDDVVSLSTFRDQAFGKDYGVVITTGPLNGLMSRAVVIVDETGVIKYTEQVPEIAQEPDYAATLAAL
ncbi:thiol peroxidase [bacterium]|nr:thiol peroxidase [bacterium]